MYCEGWMWGLRSLAPPPHSPVVQLEMLTVYLETESRDPLAHSSLLSRGKLCKQHFNTKIRTPTSAHAFVLLLICTRRELGWYGALTTNLGCCLPFLPSVTASLAPFHSLTSDWSLRLRLLNDLRVDISVLQLNKPLRFPLRGLRACLQAPLHTLARKRFLAGCNQVLYCFNEPLIHVAVDCYRKFSKCDEWSVTDRNRWTALKYLQCWRVREREYCSQ